MSWTPTLADDPERVRGLMVHEDAEVRSTTTIRAPCCGRTCAADMVMDLRSVSGTRVPKGGQRTRERVDADFACDGCLTRMLRGDYNGWTRARLMQALGAPPDEVRTQRAIEMAWERRHERHARGVPARVHLYLEAFQSELAGRADAEVAPPPATEDR